MPSLLFGTDTYIDFRGRKTVVPACSQCNMDFDTFAAPFLGKAKPKYDLSVILEDKDLVSPHLKTFLNANCTSDISYYETGGGYFVIMPNRTLFLDLSRMAPNFGERCVSCGRHVSLTANLSRPWILKGQQAVNPFDLVRTYQKFGNYRQLHSILVAGDELVAGLKAAKMKGISYIDCLESNRGKGQGPHMHFLRE